MSARGRDLARSNGRRLVSTIQRVEQQPYDFLAPRRPPRFSGTQVILILTSSGASARSGSTPGSGTGTVQSYTSGALASTSSTVTYYNANSTAVGSSKYIWCLWWAGQWWAVSGDC